MKAALLICLAAALGTAPPSAEIQLHPSTGSPELVRVIDGDTIVIREAGEQVRIRLSEIDAPELRQPYGSEAKAELLSLIEGKRFSVVREGHDRYGRTLARIYVGATDVNREMILHGAAWVYLRKGRKAPYSLLICQRLAQEKHRGLWSLPNAIKPQDWRRARQTG